MATDKPANRTERGTFAKGFSGNPFGRPKASTLVRDAARAMTTDAMNVLKAALSSDDERIRIAAANAILDRGYGKPGQSVESDDGDETLDQLSNEELRKMADDVLKD